MRIGLFGDSSRGDVAAAIDAIRAVVGDAPLLDPSAAIRDVELVVTLGGDGTILAAARALAGAQIPVAGINLGTVGFLAVFSLEELLGHLVSGTHPPAVATMRVSCRMPGGETHEALNDVVLFRGASPRMVTLELHAGDDFVCSYRGDGLIAATPCGSTAYSLSSGGPIVQPEVEALILTPISPHTMSHRPLVLPSGIALRLTLAEGADGAASVLLDGREVGGLAPGESVELGRAREAFLLVENPHRTYYEGLRAKLHWARTPGR